MIESTDTTKHPDHDLVVWEKVLRVLVVVDLLRVVRVEHRGIAVGQVRPLSDHSPPFDCPHTVEVWFVDRGPSRDTSADAFKSLLMFDSVVRRAWHSTVVDVLPSTTYPQFVFHHESTAEESRGTTHTATPIDLKKAQAVAIDVAEAMKKVAEGESRRRSDTIEQVDHPAHYGGAGDPYEVVKVAEAWGFDADAYLFSVLKYIARNGKKDGADAIVDLRKAAWYLDRKIKNMSRVRPGGQNGNGAR